MRTAFVVFCFECVVGFYFAGFGFIAEHLLPCFVTYTLLGLLPWVVSVIFNLSLIWNYDDGMCLLTAFVFAVYLCCSYCLILLG